MVSVLVVGMARLVDEEARLVSESLLRASFPKTAAGRELILDMYVLARLIRLDAVCKGSGRHGPSFAGAFEKREYAFRDPLSRVRLGISEDSTAVRSGDDGS